ncbi:hypothetical protein EOM09_05205 [bacterium]|nr:hypothetical protein [bacterium]
MIKDKNYYFKEFQEIIKEIKNKNELLKDVNNLLFELFQIVYGSESIFSGDYYETKDFLIKKGEDPEKYMKNQIGNSFSGFYNKTWKNPSIEEKKPSEIEIEFMRIFVEDYDNFKAIFNFIKSELYILDNLDIKRNFFRIHKKIDEDILFWSFIDDLSNKLSQGYGIYKTSLSTSINQLELLEKSFKNLFSNSRRYLSRLFKALLRKYDNLSRQASKSSNC